MADFFKTNKRNAGFTRKVRRTIDTTSTTHTVCVRGDKRAAIQGSARACFVNCKHSRLRTHHVVHVSPGLNVERFILDVSSVLYNLPITVHEFHDLQPSEGLTRIRRALSAAARRPAVTHAVAPPESNSESELADSGLIEPTSCKDNIIRGVWVHLGEGGRGTGPLDRYISDRLGWVRRRWSFCVLDPPLLRGSCELGLREPSSEPSNREPRMRKPSTRSTRDWLDSISG